MDYKKEYKNALERAKDFIEKQNPPAFDKDLIGTIFPELAESEDEKIRKAIIMFFESEDDNTTYSFVPKKDILAWLEKQGEQEKPQVYKTKDGEIITYSENDGYKVVEPKFHEGDWVVDNCGYVWKIEGILNKFYLLEGVEGGESRPTIEWVNKTFHLWTIQDAKDGDVLITKGKPQPFIFKKYDEDTDYVYAYCGICDLVKDDSFYANGSDEDDQLWTCYSVDGDVYPATKEQRDTLFAEMKEAGYEWSEETHQLKKIDNEEFDCSKAN